MDSFLLLTMENIGETAYGATVERIGARIEAYTG